MVMELVGICRSLVIAKAPTPIGWSIAPISFQMAMMECLWLWLCKPLAWKPGVAIPSTICPSIASVLVATVVICISIRWSFRFSLRHCESRTEKGGTEEQDPRDGWKTKASLSTTPGLEFTSANSLKTSSVLAILHISWKIVTISGQGRQQTSTEYLKCCVFFYCFRLQRYIITFCLAGSNTVARELHAFFVMSRETNLCASSGKFLHLNSCYKLNFRFNRLKTLFCVTFCCSKKTLEHNYVTAIIVLSFKSFWGPWPCCECWAALSLHRTTLTGKHNTHFVHWLMCSV